MNVSEACMYNAHRKRETINECRDPYGLVVELTWHDPSFLAACSEEVLVQIGALLLKFQAICRQARYLALRWWEGCRLRLGVSRSTLLMAATTTTTQSASSVRG